jgi:hypothetical protein
MSDSVELPSGDDYILRVLYTPKEVNGVRVSNCLALPDLRHRSPFQI